MDCVEIFPFRASPLWMCKPDEFKLWAVEDNGVIACVPWLTELTEARDLYGQYIPFYSSEEKMIRINLKGRVKKYGK